MRSSAWFERSLSFGFWLACLGCLPQQELTTYSAGMEGPALPPLEPATAPGELPNGVSPEVEAPMDGEAVASEPSDTPANTDGPAQPEQLAPEAAAPGATSPEAAPPAAEPGSEPAAEPPTPVAAPAPAAPEPQRGSEEPVPLVAADPPAPAQARFVRLVADSEFNGGPLSSAAELELFGADGEVLDRAGWAATADSAEPMFFGGAPAAMAIDGQPDSIWHTAWFQLATPPPHPHFLQLDLGQLRTVTGFRYLARQDASVGRIADYRFFVSVDGVIWGEPLLAGRLQDSAGAQDVRVAVP